MAQSVCPRCHKYINVPNVSTEQGGQCPVCGAAVIFYKCTSCMKVQTFDASVARPRQCPSCFTLVRSLAPLPLGPLPPLPLHLTPTYTFGEYKKSGDHPPTEFSVVDAHLPAIPQCGCWVTNDLPVKPDVAAIPNWENQQFVTLKYTVGMWTVFVVWPAAYKTKPPGPNRLGWLPQMEFGAKPGLIDPKKFTSGVPIRFRYNTMSGAPVDLDFTPK